MEEKMEGFLLKQGEGMVKGWKKRWFSQVGYKLFYYENKPDWRVISSGLEKGFIDLNSMTKVVTRNTSTRFEIHTPKRIWILEAPNTDEQQTWVRGLNNYLRTSRQRSATFATIALWNSKDGDGFKSAVYTQRDSNEVASSPAQQSSGTVSLAARLPSYTIHPSVQLPPSGIQSSAAAISSELRSRNQRNQDISAETSDNATNSTVGDTTTATSREQGAPSVRTTGRARASTVKYPTITYSAWERSGMTTEETASWMDRVSKLEGELQETKFRLAAKEELCAVLKTEVETLRRELKEMTSLLAANRK
eukprot:TRINITY_DN287_c0_g7_i2.p1 TRINITY_DN287_c0_g7~~TRINITY_DN287_c0_g7_i2.p1  ORF type:complete len:307 (-),score=49.90 TRINITY_DN287_c0_g7_i2:263-1183(-)